MLGDFSLLFLTVEDDSGGSKLLFLTVELDSGESPLLFLTIEHGLGRTPTAVLDRRRRSLRNFGHEQSALARDVWRSIDVLNGSKEPTSRSDVLPCRSSFCLMPSTNLLTRHVGTRHKICRPVHGVLHDAVSLSVSVDNPARRLYRRCGFEDVAAHGNSVTMLKHLK